MYFAGMGEAGHTYAESIIKLLNDGDWHVRLAAVQYFAGMGEAGHTYAESIGRLSADEQPGVREAAEHFLSDIKASTCEP
jgi:HEAT repeat protein